MARTVYCAFLCTILWQALCGAFFWQGWRPFSSFVFKVKSNKHKANVKPHDLVQTGDEIQTQIQHAHLCAFIIFHCILHSYAAVSVGGSFVGFIPVHVISFYLEVIDSTCLRSRENSFTECLNSFSGDTFHRVMLPTKYPSYFSPKHNRSVFCCCVLFSLSITPSPHFRVSTVMNGIYYYLSTC